MADLTQFLDLFNPLPGNRYIQVTTGTDESTHALQKLMQEVEGEFTIALYAEETDALKAEFPDANIQFIRNFKLPFRALPREYDTVVLKDIFDKYENKAMILKTVYKTLANAAHIIIMEKKGVLDKVKMNELLDEYEFRAPNFIDVLDEYDLVMAKKMHMWGNGL